MAASCTLRMKRLVKIWTAAAIVLLVSVGESAAQPKQILFLQSFGPHFQPWATWGEEIRKELNRRSPWPLDIQEHSLLTARDGDHAAEPKFVEYLLALYAQRQPDLIVAMGAAGGSLRPATPGRTCFRQRRCCLRRSKCAGLIHPRCPGGTSWLGCGSIKPLGHVENVLRLLPETKATSSRSSPASPKAWAWACRSRDSSRRTVGKYGQKTGNGGASVRIRIPLVKSA